MDLELLKEIGLTEGEIKVYIALFKLGSTSTGALIKESQVHASKVYPILDRLMEKGLVSYIKEGKKTIYTANPATTIISYLDKLQSKIAQQKLSAKNLIFELDILKSVGKKDTEATLFKGVKGLKAAYNLAIKDIKKNEIVYSMFLPPVADHLVPFFVNFVTKLSKEYKTKQFLMFNQNCPEAEAVRGLPNLNLKFGVPQEYKSPAEICVYGDNVVISTTGGDEYITFLIKNREISNSFKNQFSSIWNQQSYTLTGLEGVKSVFDESLNYGQIRFIGGNWGIVKYYKDFFKNWNLRRENKKVLWYDLVDSSFIVDEKEKRDKLQYYLLKKLPEQVTGPGVTFLYGNKIVYIIWGQETIINVIENRELANQYSKYFDYLWNQNVKTYSNKEGVKELLNSMLKTNSKEYFAYGGPQKSHDILGNNFWKNFHEKRVKKGINAQLVFHASLEWWGNKLNNYDLTNVKITNTNFEELTETIICGSKVAIIVWLDNPFGILIEESLVANSYKNFFDLIWEK